MSDAANELKEVKSIIRGLLISSTYTTSIRQLESDYLNQEGCIIPFKKLGYPSTESFLRSIPDTVSLREPRHGCPSSMIIVQPVQSLKSTHVEKLVVRQKPPAHKAVRGMKRPLIPSLLSQKRSSSSPSPNGLAPCFIPMALRISLNRVCQRHAQNGLPLSLLGNELSRDLSMAGWNQGGKSGWLTAFGFSSADEVIQAFIDHSLIKISMKDGTKWITSLGQKPTEEQILPAGQEDSSDDDMYEYNKNAETLVSDNMKKNFRTIMKKHPEGLWCSSLPYEYKELTGADLVVKELGFVSIIQMASQLKDVFICSRPDSNSDWLLFDSESNSVWNSPAAPTGKELKMATLPTRIIKNIESLLEAFPSGIMKHKFLDAYKEKYHEDLPMVDFGFENIMALLAHLTSRNVMHLKFCGNVPMICSPFRYRVKEDSLQELTKENDFIEALYPIGVMRPHDDIPVQSFSENFSCGCSIDVLVTEVTTPSLFWFQLWGPDIQGDFDAMMESLQELYNPGGPSDHRMPDATIQIGQFCAARYPPDPSDCGEWHRARITSLPSLSEVEVFYVDYGSKSRVLRSEIRFLELRFSNFPIQAHKAALVNIRPMGYESWMQMKGSASSEEIMKKKPVWSREACNMFLDLVANQPTVAVVAHIRDSDKLLSVALIDTSKETDRHINDLLVYAKVAEFGEMKDEEDLMFNSVCRPRSSHTCDKEGGSFHQEAGRLRPPGFRPVSIEGKLGPDVNQDFQPEYSPGFLQKENLISSEQFLAHMEAEKRQKDEILLKSIMETKKMEEMKKMDEKLMQEAQLQLELERVRLCQQQLQWQHLQTQLLLLAAQNCMMPSLPTGPSPLLSSQVMPPPPPGLSNLNPFTNAQASVSELFPRALQNNAPMTGFMSPFPVNTSPVCGNFPVGNLGCPQFLGATAFDKKQSVGSGESLPSSASLYHPPGFEHKAPIIAPPLSTAGSWPTPNIASLLADTSYKYSVSDCVGDHLSSVEKLKAEDQILQESTDSVANNLSIDPPGIFGSTYNVNSSGKRNKSNIKDEVTIQSADIPVYTNDMNKNLGNGELPERKLDIFEAVNDIHSSLEACSLSSCGESNSSSSVTDDSLNKKSYSQEKGESRNSKEKWKVNFEETNVEEGNQYIIKGTLNGKSVSVLKVGYYFYVLTEEILSVFFNNLPVHVALKIANLRPNGSKIDCISINQRKNKDLCKKIERLGTIEVNPHGSEIHLTSVESLHFFCSALGNTG